MNKILLIMFIVTNTLALDLNYRRIVKEFLVQNHPVLKTKNISVKPINIIPKSDLYFYRGFVYPRRTNKKLNYKALYDKKLKKVIEVKKQDKLYNYVEIVRPHLTKFKLSKKKHAEVFATKILSFYHQSRKNKVDCSEQSALFQCKLTLPENKESQSATIVFLKSGKK